MKLHDVSRLLTYILGHKPYESGLVPNPGGFITFKELLKAIHEESGYGSVSQGNINEVLMSESRSLFEVREKQIRALDIKWEMDLTNPAQSLPKLLFLGIRRKNSALWLHLSSGEVTKGVDIYVRAYIDTSLQRGQRYPGNISWSFTILPGQVFILQTGKLSTFLISASFIVLFEGIFKGDTLE